MGVVIYEPWLEDVPTGIEYTFEPTLPEGYYLRQNYPNPFNMATTIEFGLPRRAPVRLSVYNVLGRRVAVLLDTELPAGVHRIELDYESLGTDLASGIYFYRLETPACSQSRKMVFVK